MHWQAEKRVAAFVTSIVLLGGALMSGASPAQAATPTPTPPARPSVSATSGDGYDRYTLDECRKKDDGSPGQQWYYHNHFSSCGVARGNYLYLMGRDNTPVAWYTFRITVLGAGYRDQKKMHYELYTDQWTPHGAVDPTARIGITLSCAGVKCETTGGVDDSMIEEWITDPGKKVTADFDTMGAPPDRNDTGHYPQDRVSHHQFEVNVVSPLRTVPRGMTQRFRCDEPDNGYGGTMKPGCIYDQVPATMHYSYKKYPNLAKHIYDAQKHPKSTYPASTFPGLNLVIPGDRDAAPANRKPLRRLYPGMDSYAESYYENNRTTVSTSCAALTPKSGEECDEYPFASTWEGAYFHTKHNDPSDPDFKWYYSVRYIPGKTENGPGGTDLASWYVQDHILASDPFWVKIDDIPEGLK
ncbi:NucA/NucB deoxyribonuclease domain-containing protein [Streptomyces anandii]|uniref:NucA/NucB deoxyribonuclease domain-containing protein n=1 Tax=Streptomyces anandii TaxID=285454 RepID=UPI0037B158CD